MTLTNNPDRDWQDWGRLDPYFAVLTQARFSNANLNAETLREFFTTGERHVEHVFNVIHSSIRPDFRPRRVLDYGCGVGRLLIPFARRAECVVGVDISPDMLAQARKNCDESNANAVKLVHLSDLGSLAPASFDLIHSFIVFQHIPVKQGEQLFARLIGLLAEGGVGVIHLTYADKRSAVRRAILGVRKRLSLAHGVLNLIQKKSFSTPLMQMNSYSIDRIFDLLIEKQCSNLHVEFSDHGGFRGALLYFEKVLRSLL